MRSFAAFHATVTQVGRSNPSLPCFDKRTHSKTIVIGESESFSCLGNLHEYMFNLRTGRFLATYLEGYLDGKDNNENNPAVEGGICTKFE